MMSQERPTFSLLRQLGGGPTEEDLIQQPQAVSPPGWCSGAGQSLAGLPVVPAGCEQDECPRHALFGHDTGKTSGGLSFLDSIHISSQR